MEGTKLVIFALEASKRLDRFVCAIFPVQTTSDYFLCFVNFF